MEQLTCYEFNSRPKGIIEVRHYDDIFILAESHRDLISPLYSEIRMRYPEAYSDLCERYKDSIQNTWYFEYRVCVGFIKCNWGTFDGKWDIDENGDWHFEFHICPMSGECKSEGRICDPREKLPLSEAELRVAVLIANGQKLKDIADTLFIAYKTVESHNYNINKKLNIDSNIKLADWCRRKKLI